MPALHHCGSDSRRAFASGTGGAWAPIPLALPFGLESHGEPQVVTAACVRAHTPCVRAITLRVRPNMPCVRPHAPRVHAIAPRVRANMPCVRPHAPCVHSNMPCVRSNRPCVRPARPVCRQTGLVARKTGGAFEIGKYLPQARCRCVCLPDFAKSMNQRFALIIPTRWCLAACCSRRNRRD